MTTLEEKNKESVATKKSQLTAQTYQIGIRNVEELKQWIRAMDLRVAVF